MEVAQQLFAAQGYPDTTVDDIARAAGASRATFYLHFKSKAELMGSAIDAMVPMAVETYHVLDGHLADDGPQLPSRLRGWLAEWLERWTDGAQASHATLQATMLEPEVELHYLRLSEALVDSLVGYFGRMPAAERASARERALVLEIMTQRIFALASRSKLPVAEDALLDILAEFWLQVFACDPAASLGRDQSGSEVPNSPAGRSA
jgi:AcrR family transcriptional regulator